MAYTGRFRLASQAFRPPCRYLTWGDRTPPPPLAQPTHERPNRPGWPRPRLRGGPSADWRWPWTSDWWWSCWTCCGGSGA